MANAPTSTPTQSQVALEQLRAHYAQIPAMALAPTLGGLFTVWVLWDAVDNRILVAGMAAVFCLSALRLLLWRHFFRLPAEQAALPRWRVIAVIGAGISGCIWGSAAPFLYPPQAGQYEVYLVVLLTLLPIVPVSALAAYMPAMYAYFIPCITPWVLTLAWQDTRGERMTALLLVMMMAAMLAFARRYGQALADSMTLRVRLAEQSGALQEAVRQKTRFIAAAGHDLRQPVHAMGMFMASLREGAGAAANAQLLAHLEASLADLRNMLTNMLDTSRLDAEVIGPSLQSVALDQLLRGIVESHAPLAAHRQLDLRCLCSRGVPAVVRSDPALLERIVRNLLANALKYTRSGGVALLCRAHGPLVRLQVLDTGPGMSPADLEVAFDEYTQLAAGRTHDDDAGGLGLGLAIVRRMTRLLGHALHVRSAPGRGTVFTLSLERGDPQADPAQATQHPPVPHETLPPADVLLIDDHEAARVATAALLRQWGLRVSACGSAADALSLLSARRVEPAVMVVDYRLGEGRSGLDAAALVRRHLGRPVPVVLITGDTAPDRIVQAHAAGHALLHKPVDPQRLRGCIAEACNAAASAAVRSGPAASP